MSIRPWGIVFAITLLYLANLPTEARSHVNRRTARYQDVSDIYYDDEAEDEPKLYRVSPEEHLDKRSINPAPDTFILDPESLLRSKRRDEKANLYLTDPLTAEYGPIGRFSAGASSENIADMPVTAEQEQQVESEAEQQSFGMGRQNNQAHQKQTSNYLTSQQQGGPVPQEISGASNDLSAPPPGSQRTSRPQQYAADPQQLVAAAAYANFGNDQQAAQQQTVEQLNSFGYPGYSQSQQPGAGYPQSQQPGAGYPQQQLPYQGANPQQGTLAQQQIDQQQQVLLEELRMSGLDPSEIPSAMNGGQQMNYGFDPNQQQQVSLPVQPQSAYTSEQQKPPQLPGNMMQPALPVAYVPTKYGYGQGQMIGRNGQANLVPQNQFLGVGAMQQPQFSGFSPVQAGSRTRPVASIHNPSPQLQQQYTLGGNQAQQIQESSQQVPAQLIQENGQQVPAQLIQENSQQVPAQFDGVSKLTLEDANDSGDYLLLSQQLKKLHRNRRNSRIFATNGNDDVENDKKQQKKSNLKHVTTRKIQITRVVKKKGPGKKHHHVTKLRRHKGRKLTKNASSKENVKVAPYSIEALPVSLSKHTQLMADSQFEKMAADMIYREREIKTNKMQKDLETEEHRDAEGFVQKIQQRHIALIIAGGLYVMVALIVVVIITSLDQRKGTCSDVTQHTDTECSGALATLCRNNYYANKLLRPAVMPAKQVEASRKQLNNTVLGMGDMLTVKVQPPGTNAVL